jgi:hypothetical protein
VSDAPFGGLDLCSCKRGFFTLRDCANSAAATCSVCSRRICQQHMTQDGTCVECAAKRQENAAFIDDPTGSAVRYRQRWYQSSGYDPIWWASSDPYWNDQGYRWYDDPAYDDANDNDGGFGDS